MKLRRLMLRNVGSNPKKTKSSDHIEVPTVVSLEDIHANNKLLTDKDIKNIQAIFDKHKDKNDDFLYLSKKKLGKNIKFSCMKAGGELYAIYSGKSQGKELGEGGYGVTKLAQNLQTGEWYVLKVQECLEGKKGEKQQNEARILQELGLAIAAGISESKVKGHRYKILMHFVPGETLAQLQKKDRINHLPFEERIKLVTGISALIDELHTKKILHWDLHDGNIMIDLKSNKVGLIDFGSSKQYDVSDLAAMQEFEKDKRTELQTAFNALIDLLGFEPVFTMGKFNLTAKSHANFPDEETKRRVAQMLLEIKTAINNPTTTQQAVQPLFKNLQMKMCGDKQPMLSKGSASHVFRELDVSAEEVKHQLQHPGPAARKPPEKGKKKVKEPVSKVADKEKTNPKIKLR